MIQGKARRAGRSDPEQIGKAELIAYALDILNGDIAKERKMADSAERDEIAKAAEEGYEITNSEKFGDDDWYQPPDASYTVRGFAQVSRFAYYCARSLLKMAANDAALRL